MFESGGVILIKTMNAGNGILAVTTLYTDLTHKTMFDEFSLKELLVRSGFHSEKIKIKKANLYCFYANPLNYIAWGTELISSLILRVYFLIHNKKNKIFTKNIIAVVRK